MYLNCRVFSGFNGRLPFNLDLNKAMEALYGTSCTRRWRGKVLILGLVGFVTIIWGFMSFNDGSLGLREKAPDMGGEKAWILQQHFNISKSQVLAFASLFSESDQITSLECTKEPGPRMMLSNVISCSLKVLCSDEEAENEEAKDQCLVQDENVPKKRDASSLEDKSTSCTTQSTVSANRIFGKNNLDSVAQQCAKEDSQLLCTLVIRWWWAFVGMIMCYKLSGFSMKLWRNKKQKVVQKVQEQPLPRRKQPEKLHQQAQKPPKVAGTWRTNLLIVFIIFGCITSLWLLYHLCARDHLWRVETLSNMCDERARMLQDQFNVSLNHVHALAILVSTFHHGKQPTAIDQKTFGEYTERTSFERPLTSGVAYALKVTHAEREHFEKEHGWTIKKMETEDQTLVQDFITESLASAPIQDEYAPVIFSQETVSHIVSIDMMSGKEDRENILRARATGKGVLTSPFKLLKSNHLGVVLTFAVYNADLPPDATPEQRIQATVGYLGASYDVPSLVEKLLHQLASKQTIVVNVYDTTNASAPINMYGTDVVDTGLLRISNLDFGDPQRKHEMQCRFKHKPPFPLTAASASIGVLVITLLVSHIFYAAISRIAKVEADYREMMELKVRAEAADVAKSQFLATVSHEIRTPMNGVLGMLQMLMDTDLGPNQQDYAETAHASGRELISLINEVLDQAKIESGRLELETVPFDLRSVLDNVLSLNSGKSNEKGIELAAYVSNMVPEVVIGDPGRFRQIITNLVGNSIKFTHDKGHIFVSVHLVDEVRAPPDLMDEVLRQGLHLVGDVSNVSNKTYNTLSGFPVVNRWKSWEGFKSIRSTTPEESDMIKLLVTVEDTGVGIPLDAQSRIFTPFMQADSSTSRTYGGTGIGLSISKRLVDLMSGEIGFVSEPGTGSTFSFTGSFGKGEISSLETKWHQYEPAVSEFQGLRALVIDNKTIRTEITKYHMQRLGIFVDTASCLESACTYLSSAGNTSLSTQLAMVVIDKDVWDKEAGIILHHSINEHRKNNVESLINLPKILLLATSITPVERNVVTSLDLVDKVLSKPLRLSVLIACFQEALGSRKKRLLNANKPTLGKLLRERRILVVDDNVVNRRVAEGALKKYGAIVTCVESGKAALLKLKPPHNFDACFMDLQMPEMDGFEATRLIRGMESEVNEKIAAGEASVEIFGNVENWHTPILAMTADVIQASNEECMKCGMDDYVSKPFEEEQLYSAVARFFESG